MWGDAIDRTTLGFLRIDGDNLVDSKSFSVLLGGGGGHGDDEVGVLLP
uniref:Uncharacterized protein n=1 Tax=Arundo donax TaxID=35708 RepID=A0A0A8ZX08_ARUDO